VEQDDQFFGPFLSFRAPATVASMST